MKTFTSGARSSEEAPRLDLIPLASLKRQADRMQMGAASHGERNYEKGATDPVFIRDRKNHLVLHALSYLAGDESDDHLGAILANAGMLARLEEMGAVPVRESGITNGNQCHAGEFQFYPSGSFSRVGLPAGAPPRRSYDEVRAEASKCEYCDRPNLTNPKACAGGCKFGGPYLARR